MKYLASFYGLRVCLDNSTGEVVGVNRFVEMLLPVAFWLHNAFAWVRPDMGQQGFPFRIIEEVRK